MESVKNPDVYCTVEQVRTAVVDFRKILRQINVPRGEVDVCGLISEVLLWVNLCVSFINTMACIAGVPSRIKLPSTEIEFERYLGAVHAWLGIIVDAADLAIESKARANHRPSLEELQALISRLRAVVQSTPNTGVVGVDGKDVKWLQSCLRSIEMLSLSKGVEPAMRMPAEAPERRSEIIRFLGAADLWLQVQEDQVQRAQT